MARVGIRSVFCEPFFLGKIGNCWFRGDAQLRMCTVSRLFWSRLSVARFQASATYRILEYYYKSQKELRPYPDVVRLVSLRRRVFPFSKTLCGSLYFGRIKERSSFDECISPLRFLRCVLWSGRDAARRRAEGGEKYVFFAYQVTARASLEPIGLRECASNVQSSLSDGHQSV